MARWTGPGLLGWVLGTALQLQQAALFESLVLLAMAAAAVVLLVLAVRLAQRPIAAKTTILMACGLLAFVLTTLRAESFFKTRLEPALEGIDLVVTGVVAAMPQVNESATRFRLDLEAAHVGKTSAAGQTTALLPPRIYLSWYAAPVLATPQLLDAPGQLPKLYAGDRWQFTVRLKAPHGSLNPHGFDFELWLWEQGLQATGYVRSGPADVQARRIGSTWAHPVERLRQGTRDAIVQRLGDRTGSGVVAALVTGDQNAIDRAEWDIFRATGVAHLMSISGLHITMFAWLAVAMVGWLWRRSPALCLYAPAPVVAALGGVALALAYALFSGWGVPSQRTVLMLAVVTLLRLSGKRWPWPLVWLLACAVVVLADPWALMQAGFWLSFVAVGVLFASDGGSQQKPPPGLRYRVLALLREQGTITLALAPLTLLLFAQVSLVGLVANLFAIPWVTLVVTPLAMLGTAVPALWDGAALAMQALSVVLRQMAALPYATVNVAQAPLAYGMAAVLGGVCLVLRLPWRLRCLGLPLLLPVLLWQAPRPAVGEFELLALDIGQGTAVLVQTAHHTLLYDTGPRFSRESDAGHRVLVPLLRALNVKLDTLVLSHRDLDHIGGAPAVLAMQPQAKLLSSIEDSHILQTQHKAERCLAGQNWQWDGVQFEFLHPSAGDYETQAKSNAMSCVLKVSTAVRQGARNAALLTGDIELAQETRLVQAQNGKKGDLGDDLKDGLKAGLRGDLKADLLVVPHHGSKTSSSAQFLDSVQPKIALVQSGYRNRFGHPALEVEERYLQRDIELVDSPHCGAATWRSNSPDAVDCERQTRQRYWHHRVP